MAALQDDVKAYIVRALACYETPSQVANAVHDQFKIVVSRQQVALYDPEKYAGRSLGAKWKALFFDTRKIFREEMADIAIAHRAARLRALGRILEKAEEQHNIGLVLQILEQAAREVGNMYVSNRQGAPKSGQGAVDGFEIVEYGGDSNIT